MENHYILEVPQKDGRTTLMAQPPVKMDTTETDFRYGTPAPGEHTRQVLEELGYSAEEIRSMAEARAVQLYEG